VPYRLLQIAGQHQPCQRPRECQRAATGLLQRPYRLPTLHWRGRDRRTIFTSSRANDCLDNATDGVFETATSRQPPARQLVPRFGDSFMFWTPRTECSRCRLTARLSDQTQHTDPSRSLHMQVSVTTYAYRAPKAGESSLIEPPLFAVNTELHCKVRPQTDRSGFVAVVCASMQHLQRFASMRLSTFNQR
jgi:hypothetical protein